MIANAVAATHPTNRKSKRIIFTNSQELPAIARSMKSNSADVETYA